MENQNLYPIVPPMDIKMATAPPLEPQAPPPSYEQSFPNQPPPQLQPLDPAAMNAPPPQIIIHEPSFGKQSQVVYCPNCGETRRTRLEYAPGLRTHIIAIALCFTALWPCACAPYCCCANDLCQYPTHYCENCGNFLGASKECC